MSLDECWVDCNEKGEQYGCDLETFTSRYTNELLKKVCNVIESYINE